MAGKILITPNQGSTTVGQDPTIKFQGVSVSTDITLRVTSTGTISFEGSAGQLFSITDTMTGTIFSVNDVSGIPSIEVLSSGLIKLGQYGGNIVLGTATDNGTDKLQVNGSASATSFNATSTQRVKKEIKNLSSAYISKFDNLTPREYDRIDYVGHEFGFIAEEMDLVYPEIVGKDKAGIPTGIDYGKLSAILTAKIQHQQVTINKLKKQMAEVNKLLKKQS
jgi:hypothetical protein